MKEHNVEESNKIFTHTTQLTNNFENQHNNLSNNFRGVHKVYVNSEGIPFHSKIEIQELVLNSNSEKIFKNLILEEKDRKEILGKQTYKAFTNKKTLSLTYKQLIDLNKFLNNLEKKDLNKIHSLLFGKNNALNIEENQNNKTKLIELLNKSKDNYKKKTKTIKKFIEKEETLGNVEEITIEEWLDKFLTTYGKITSKEEENTIRDSLRDNKLNKNFQTKMVKFLKKYSKKIIEFTLEVEKQKKSYRDKFDEEFPIKVLRALHNFIYEKKSEFLFQRAHIKAQSNIISESFELMIPPKKNHSWKEKLLEISTPKNIIPLRNDIHTAYDRHFFYISENGNIRRGPHKVNDVLWQRILQWAKEENFLKLPEYYIVIKKGKEKKIPYLSKKLFFIKENKRIMLTKPEIKEEVLKDAERLKVNVHNEDGVEKHIEEIFYLLEREYLLKKLKTLNIKFERDTQTKTNKNGKELTKEVILVNKVVKSNQELERLINRTELTRKLKDTIVTDENYQDLKYLIEKTKEESILQVKNEKIDLYKIDTKGKTLWEIDQEIKKRDEEIIRKANEKEKKKQANEKSR